MSTTYDPERPRAAINPQLPQPNQLSFELSPKEQSLLEAITLAPEMSVADYAQVIIQEQNKWHGGSGRPKVFIDFVRNNMSCLFLDSSKEEIDTAREIFQDYSQSLYEKSVKLRESYKGSPAGIADSEQLVWNRKVRVLADLDRKTNVVPHTHDGQSVFRFDDSQSEEQRSSIQFWQGIYRTSVGEKKAGNSEVTYIFGPDIEHKVPDILLEFLEAFRDKDTIKEVFPDSNSVSNDSRNLLTTTHDGFRNLVKEAERAGWPNAAAVKKIYDALPKRDIPMQALIISVGNEVARILRGANISADNITLDKQRIVAVENVPEAINRCLFLMFELGKEPKGHDPLNFLLQGQILNEVARMIQPLREQR